MSTLIPIRVETLPAPISHYTDAVQAGDLVFVSGCTASNQQGSVDSDDVTDQARAALTTIGRILEASGSSFSDIAKVTVYLTDIEDRARINPVRQEFFGSHRPASTLVQVCALAVPGAKVEIEAVAVIPRSVGA
jgi:2-iminobutanoate/2-iminopropanoate deaminase